MRNVISRYDGYPRAIASFALASRYALAGALTALVKRRPRNPIVAASPLRHAPLACPILLRS